MSISDETQRRVAAGFDLSEVNSYRIDRYFGQRRYPTVYRIREDVTQLQSQVAKLLEKMEALSPVETDKDKFLSLLIGFDVQHTVKDYSTKKEEDVVVIYSGEGDRVTGYGMAGFVFKKDTGAFDHMYIAIQ